MVMFYLFQHKPNQPLPKNNGQILFFALTHYGNNQESTKTTITPPKRQTQNRSYPHIIIKKNATKTTNQSDPNI